MEHTGQTIYGFYDGDFTFHVAEHENPRHNHVFRVRIDNASPEARAEENTRNHNNAPTGWSRVRDAAPEEVETWTCFFGRRFPVRRHEHTRLLRRLRIAGALRADALSNEEEDAAHDLSRPILCVKDFRPQRACFVSVDEGVVRLTADGLWLTSLMK